MLFLLRISKKCQASGFNRRLVKLVFVCVYLLSTPMFILLFIELVHKQNIKKLFDCFQCFKFSLLIARIKDE